LVAAAVLVWPAPAAESDGVAKAVAAGVAYLRTAQAPDGSWNRTYLGSTALAGLTLLECGVARDDRAVVAAARAVREGGGRCVHTYSVALAILFLDRLGDPADFPLLESLTARLVAGQNGEGGWTYQCPSFPHDEAKRLAALPRAPREDDALAAQGRREARPFSPDCQKLLDLVARNPRLVPAGYGDNSNTQFANLALWVAGRHGLPVNEALAAIAARYRRSQQADGTWPYTAASPANPMPPGVDGRSVASRASMTCAGLLGLAIADGAGHERKGIQGDMQVQAALLALSTVVGDPTGGRRRPPPLEGGAYYFLWSLERLCVALDLETLGHKRWYDWGAEALLANQTENGSWRGEYAEYHADTCFALLFLRRANLASDLTARVKGKVKDPGNARLRTGGRAAGRGRGRPGQDAAAPADGAAQLADELVRAPEAAQADLLRKLQEGRGVEYTEALVATIGKLKGEGRELARAALVRRLTRMGPSTTGRYLKDEEAEIRRAAALACAAQRLKAHVPQLLPLLRDADRAVAEAAHAALKELTGKDLGPDADAWQAWWDKGGKD
jgi:hypothetical protein